MFLAQVYLKYPPYKFAFFGLPDTGMFLKTPYLKDPPPAVAQVEALAHPDSQRHCKVKLKSGGCRACDRLPQRLHNPGKENRVPY